MDDKTSLQDQPRDAQDVSIYGRSPTPELVPRVKADCLGDIGTLPTLLVADVVERMLPRLNEARDSSRGLATRGATLQRSARASAWQSRHKQAGKVPLTGLQATTRCVTPLTGQAPRSHSARSRAGVNARLQSEKLR